MNSWIIILPYELAVKYNRLRKLIKKKWSWTWKYHILIRKHNEYGTLIVGVLGTIWNRIKYATIKLFVFNFRVWDHYSFQYLALCLPVRIGFLSFLVTLIWAELWNLSRFKTISINLKTRNGRKFVINLTIFSLEHQFLNIRKCITSYLYHKL